MLKCHTSSLLEFVHFSCFLLICIYGGCLFLGCSIKGKTVGVSYRGLSFFGIWLALLTCNFCYLIVFLKVQFCRLFSIFFLLVWEQYSVAIFFILSGSRTFREFGFKWFTRDISSFALCWYSDKEVCMSPLMGVFSPLVGASGFLGYKEPVEVGTEPTAETRLL